MDELIFSYGRNVFVYQNIYNVIELSKCHEVIKFDFS